MEDNISVLRNGAVDIMRQSDCRNSDIFEHLPTLYEYAKKCRSVAELGVRSCVSSYPIITGLIDGNDDYSKLRMLSVDLSMHENTKKFEEHARNVISYEFFEGNDLDYEIRENFDMVFIDTWHVRAQLQRELEKYGPRCNKYILMHDTSVDEFVGESIRNGWNIEQQSKDTGFSKKEIQEGLWPAIQDFLSQNSEWRLRERFFNNNGLTILERIQSRGALQIREIMRESKCKDIVLVTYGNTKVFLEITRTLQEQLIDIGLQCYQTTSVTEYNSTTFYILFNAHHRIEPLSNHIKYAVFNYEQAGSSYIRYSHYIDKMSHGVCVFDYSDYNREYLEKVINKRVFVIPYCYHPSLTLLKPNENNDEEYDIVFYGTMNENRKKYFDLLSSTGYKVKFDFGYGLFGDELINALRNAKIVLNLHYYENPSVLEISRIIPLISNYKLVLSEKSSDTKADERFFDMVEFIDVHTIIDACKKYLENPSLRYEKVKRAFEIFSSEII